MVQCIYTSWSPSSQKKVPTLTHVHPKTDIFSANERKGKKYPPQLLINDNSIKERKMYITKDKSYLLNVKVYGI